MSLSQAEKWLWTYEELAEAYAVQLLTSSEHNVRTPDEFIDLVVVAKRGYVIFTEHNDGGREFTVGYFPLASPSSTGGELERMDWVHLRGKWYGSSNLRKTE